MVAARGASPLATAVLAALSLWLGLAVPAGVEAVPEPGIWTATVSSGSIPVYFKKILFNHTNIQLKLEKFDCPKPVKITVAWYLKYNQCYNKFSTVEDLPRKTEVRDFVFKNDGAMETIDCDKDSHSITLHNKKLEQTFANQSKNPSSSAKKYLHIKKILN